MSRIALVSLLLISAALIYFKEYTVYGIQRLLGIDWSINECIEIKLPESAIPLIIYKYNDGKGMHYGLVNDNKISSDSSDSFVIIRDLEHNIKYTFSMTSDDYISKQAMLIQRATNTVVVSGQEALYMSSGEWLGIPSLGIEITAVGTTEKYWWENLTISNASNCND